MVDPIKGTWDRILRFWPIALFVIGASIAVGETRIRVINLEEKLKVDQRQWKEISELQTVATEYRTWRMKIDEVVTPMGVQEWGVVKLKVKEFERRIERLEQR